MKKNYEEPILNEVKVEIEDIIAASGASDDGFGEALGDFINPFPFAK